MVTIDHTFTVKDAVAQAAALLARAEVGLLTGRRQGGYETSADGTKFEACASARGGVLLTVDQPDAAIAFRMSDAAAYQLACALILMVGESAAHDEARNVQSRAIAAARRSSTPIASTAPSAG